MTTTALLDLARHADILTLALSSRRGVCDRGAVASRLRHALQMLEAARPWGDEGARVGRVVGAGERALVRQAAGQGAASSESPEAIA